MGQQHAQCDCVAPGIFSGELCCDSHHGQVQVEQAAFVEDHGHAGSRDHFCNRGEIKNGGFGCFRRIGLVGEMAEGFQSYEIAVLCDGDGSCREDAICDCLPDQFKRGSEDRVLLPMGWNGEACGSFDRGQRLRWLDVWFIAKFCGRVKTTISAGRGLHRVERTLLSAS